MVCLKDTVLLLFWGVGGRGWRGVITASSHKIEVSHFKIVQGGICYLWELGVQVAAPRSSTQDLHDDTGIPWLDTQRKVNCCIQAYRLTNGINPTALTRVFEPKVSTRQLRSSSSIVHDMPRTRTKFAERDFTIRSKDYWKWVPPDIQCKLSVSAFKNALKGLDIFGHVR